ncbi:MAG: NUDIX hydrolase [Azospira oryzae]|jgi:8-oxo-dGTP diphosphatase|nr:NUDIX hydrolase [Cytophaga sp.]PZR36618.1 MAG: NUDIX hydrolase [Azospira oryzae]
MQSQDLQHFIDHGHQVYLPHVSIDCAVFGFHENELKILLLKWKHLNGWSLPGGYILRTEHADVAAHRLLKQRTGLDQVFLQQYHTFSGPGRNKIQDSSRAIETNYHVVIPEDNWLKERVVSIGYYALVEYSKVTNPQPDALTETCAWCDIHELPTLLFDHQEMISEALKALRAQLIHHPVGLNLLPKEFTMLELQRLYETILDTTLDRANFRKKLLGLKILKKTGERPSGKAHKTPHLYSFDKRQYAKALKNGISFS